MRIGASKVLVLSPHTDDAFIGAGGLIHKLSRQGARIVYHAFAVCDDTLAGTRFPSGELAREDKKAARMLGIQEVVHHEYENKKLHESRQDILDVIYEHREAGEVDLVIAPYEGDFHQDHRTVAIEALRASTRHAVTVIQYPVIGSSKDFNPNIYVPLTEEEVAVKIKAISYYKTQFDLRGSWFNVENFMSQMRTFGVYVDSPFAEAFIQVKGTWIL